jgi:hypothetical protein
VAGQAGVSTDFLYRSPELLTRIERHRANGGATLMAPADPPGDTSTAAAVRAPNARLTQQQQAHHAEVLVVLLPKGLPPWGRALMANPYLVTGGG